MNLDEYEKKIRNRIHDADFRCTIHIASKVINKRSGIIGENESSYLEKAFFEAGRSIAFRRILGDIEEYRKTPVAPANKNEDECRNTWVGKGPSKSLIAQATDSFLHGSY